MVPTIGDDLPGRDRLAAIREPVEHAIRIARAQDRDAHGRRRAERAAVAYQRALGNVFDRQNFGLPGERRLHVQDLRGPRAARRARRNRTTRAPPAPCCAMHPCAHSRSHWSQDVCTQSTPMPASRTAARHAWNRANCWSVCGEVKSAAEAKWVIRPSRRACRKPASAATISCRLRACAQPPHAAVDLQMKGQRPPGAPSHTIQLRDVVERMRGRRQIVLHHRFPLLRQEPGHHQDARRDPRRAQSHAFVHRTDRQPFRTLADERARNRQRAVPVSVGLHHRHHLHARTHGRADIAVVACDAIERDQHVGAIGRRHVCFLGGAANLGRSRLSGGQSRLKAGCGQNCPPHYFIIDRNRSSYAVATASQQ